MQRIQPILVESDFGSNGPLAALQPCKAKLRLHLILQESAVPHLHQRAYAGKQALRLHAFAPCLCSGFRVVRYRLSRLEVQFIAGLAVISLYLGVFEVLLGGFQASNV